MFTRSSHLYDAIYLSFKSYATEAATVDDIIRSRRADARSLLDVACGTGLHLLHLRETYDVQGIDLDPELLELARGRNPGTTLHEGDMRDFDLGRRFDAVVCLFSAIGYMESVADLRRAIATMARHLEPGGVLIVEPWLTPETFESGHLGSVFVDQPELKVARMNLTEVEGRTSRFTFHYLVGTPDGVEHFTEDHALTLFTHGEYAEAFTAAGLKVDHEPEGLMGRGLFIGVAA